MLSAADARRLQSLSPRPPGPLDGAWAVSQACRDDAVRALLPYARAEVLIACAARAGADFAVLDGALLDDLGWARLGARGFRASQAGPAGTRTVSWGVTTRGTKEAAPCATASPAD